MPMAKGNSASHIDLHSFTLLLNGQKDILSGELQTGEQEFIRSLTLQFR